MNSYSLTIFAHLINRIASQSFKRVKAYFIVESALSLSMLQALISATVLSCCFIISIIMGAPLLGLPKS